MATIIDALVTTLTLDNTGFRNRARDSMEDTDALQRSGKRLGQTFATVRNEVLGFMLALAGARSIRDFTADIINGDAATGRLATNLGIATTQLSAWEGAIQRVGGNAKSADAALQSMVSAVQDFKLTGNSAIGPDLMGLGVTKFNDPTEMLLQIAEAGQRMNRPEFAARLSRIGFDQDTINLLSKGRDGVQELLREQEKLGVTTDASAKSAQDFQDAMARLRTEIRGAARPAVVELTNDLNTLASDKEGINGFFDGVASVLHRVTLGFRLVRAGLNDYVTMWRQFRAGDFAGASRTFQHGSVEQVQNEGRAAPSPGGRSIGDIRRSFPGYQGGEAWRRDGSGGGNIEAYMRSRGFSAEQARGIAAGVHAEGGGLGMAANGAFGLGQWRGARQRGLFQRYGRSPTREQQLEYLAWELHGGDHGGAAVGRETTAMGAADAYIRSFMRPAAGAETLGDLRRAQRYLGNPTAAGGGGQRSSSVTIGSMTVVSSDPKSFAKRDLAQALESRGVIVQASRGVTP